MQIGANLQETSTWHTVTVRDVPVSAFWSVTVYNADGYLQANELGANSYNNLTADADVDGSFTIHFGGCEDGRINWIPVTPGWRAARASLIQFTVIIFDRSLRTG